ncbi:hypothetical protein N431DRAFT_469092 [Stipitochalara longipes BDJ]|nr:hypothetical protein N431DRAFT_469092 [Stipitochalara longipes BDJ]
MPKLQKRLIRLHSHLRDIRRTISLISSQDLVARQYTPSKRHVYHQLVEKLKSDLQKLETALQSADSMTVKIRWWRKGFDLEREVKQLKARSERIWEDLNQGPLRNREDKERASEEERR